MTDTTAATGQPLTARETEILRHAAQGLTNRAISQALWLSPETVKSHLARAYRKLGARGRTHAAHLLAGAAETSSR